MRRAMKLLIIALTGHYLWQSVEGTPVTDQKRDIVDHDFRGPRIITKNARFIPELPISWSLPTFPSISVSSFFRDDDQEWRDMKKRLDFLEESHERIIEQMKRLNGVLKLNNKQATPALLQNVEKSNVTAKSGTIIKSSNTTESINSYKGMTNEKNSEKEPATASTIATQQTNKEEDKAGLTFKETQTFNQHGSASGNSENTGHGENGTLTKMYTKETKDPSTEIRNNTTNKDVLDLQDFQSDNINNPQPSKLVLQAKRNSNVRFETDEINFDIGRDRKLRFPDS